MPTLQQWSALADDPGYVAPAATAVLLAVVRRNITRQPTTIRAIALDVDRSPSATFKQLRALRHRGLVVWDDYKPHTIRPTLLPVAHDGTRFTASIREATSL